jgi:hypothetical protein
MVQLRVFDISASGSRFILRERAGSFHVAVNRNACRYPVRLSEIVACHRAALGPDTLRSLESGQACAVDFAAVDCSLADALQHLQELTAGLTY